MIIKIQSISYIDAQKLNPGFIRFFTIWCLGFNPEVFLIRNFLTFLTISSNETNLKAKIRHPILSVFLLIERMLDIYNWQTKAFWTSSSYKKVLDIWSPSSCKNARALFSPFYYLRIHWVLSKDFKKKQKSVWSKCFLIYKNMYILYIEIKHKRQKKFLVRCPLFSFVSSNLSQFYF